MIFQLSIGSRGLANEAYSVRIPITPAPGQEIEIGQGVCFTYEHCHIEIVPEEYFYSFTAGEFSSKEDAVLWLSKFSVALLWTNVRLRLGLAFESAATEVKLYEQPITIAPGSMAEDTAKSMAWADVDGFYSAEDTVIRPEHKRLIRQLGGRPTVTLQTGFSRFIEALEEGLRYPRPNNVLANRKLRLAMDIYSGSFLESRSAGRFLALMTVLETLAEPCLRPEPMVECVQSFVDQLEAQRDRLEGSCGQSEFDSLIGSLRHLREKSIGQKIKSLLHATLGDTPENVHVARFSHLYRIRSQLVHEGLSEPHEIGKAISALDILVPAVLRSLLLRSA
jgi:hypothetical protein